jgi:hypothetical protein
LGRVTRIVTGINAKVDTTALIPSIDAAQWVSVTVAMADKNMLNASQLEALAGISFVTDPGGTILAIGAKRWNAFAGANGALELTDQAAIGRNLFDFVSGADNGAHLQRVMKELSVGIHDSWAMPFRCDGPDRERNMWQSVTPFRSGRDCAGFLFQSIELSSNHRPPIELFDFKAMQRRSEQEAKLPMISICSWCLKVRYSPVTGEFWVKPEDYYAAGGRSRVRISHGICPTCRDTAENSFRDS